MITVAPGMFETQCGDEFRRAVLALVDQLVEEVPGRG